MADILDNFGFLDNGCMLNGRIVKANYTNMKAAAPSNTYTFAKTFSVVQNKETVRRYTEGKTYILNADQVAKFTAMGYTPTAV